jgi:hypothetical protein
MRAGYLSQAKPLLLALPILGIVLVSGCTWPGTTTTSGAGVVVKEFAPEFTEIYAGEPVTFRLLMQNQGSVDAKYVHAELLGLDEDWCSSQTGSSTCTSSIGERLEKLPNEPECSYKDNTGFNLLAPDATRGTSGASHICTWTYKAPPIQKGFTITYTPIARTYYSYSGGVTKLITFGSSSELRRIQDSGGKLPVETKSQTSGPITVDIQTQGPIRFWGDEKKITFPLEVTINNVGGGVACALGSMEGYGMTSEWFGLGSLGSSKGACKSDEKYKNKVYIAINLGTNSKMTLSDDCKGFDSGKTISLWKGQSNSIVCEVTATDLDATGPSQKAITVQAVYEYYTDTSSSIKVIGRTTSS